MLSLTTSKLIAAYDRLLDAHKVETGAQFNTYCAKHGADREALLAEARIKVASDLAAMRRR